MRTSPIFKYYQYATLHAFAADYFHDLWYSLASRFDHDLIEVKINKIRDELDKGLDELSINNMLIELFKLLGFKVSDKSNKPDYPDIVLEDVKVFFEVKLSTAGQSAFDQVRSYLSYYGTEYRGVLVAPRFSDYLEELAVSFGVSLIDFDDLFNLIRIVSLFGLDKSDFRSILLPGKSKRVITDAFNRYFKAFNMFIDLFRTGTQIGMVYSDKLSAAVYSVSGHIYDNEELLKLIKRLDFFPLSFVRIVDNKIIFNSFSIIYSFPKFVIKMIKEVMKK